jgi:ubiquinone/menaquinone biosynthesis C-methylase UbiE
MSEQMDKTRSEQQIFEEYAKNIHFLDEGVPELLEKCLKQKTNSSILDLGCGEGKILFALKNKNLLKNCQKIVGVDISNVRIQKFLQSVDGSIGIVSDACNVKQLEDSSFDVIISSMVIEHVPDDRLLLKEIKRLLKKDGRAYVSSVIKGKHSFYIYKNNGVMRLDPTHVREYDSEENLKSLIISQGLDPIEIKVKQIKYSSIDIIIRAILKMKLIRSDNKIFLKKGMITKLRESIQIPIPGYNSIEVVMKNK